jgi:hypothetical protein
MDGVNQTWMYVAGSPIYVWLGAAMIASVIGLLFLILLGERFGPKPLRRAEIGNTVVEVWVRERRLPTAGEAIIVPVAPDLKMATGIAKWVRDSTANAVQYEALEAAPLPPGSAFVGTGGKYRFGVSALAVVMDEQKRTSPEWISTAIAKALVLCRQKDVQVCILPDMTEDLLRQPKWITDEQRRETCRPIARAMIDGILRQDDVMDVVRVWVWRKGNEDIFVEELDRVTESGLGFSAEPAQA